MNMFRPPVKRLYVNLDEMCRLCLNESPDELVDIFNNDENCSLSIRIMACSALEVQQQDALPKTICLDCRQTLEKFYFFRKKSKNSDTKLRRHLRLVNAGKNSQVFNVSDDEDEDDYVESRRLFELWDREKETNEAKSLEERRQREALAVQQAIAEEKVRFRAEEADRISAELREELEPEIRVQVEEELRDTLEPLMRDQIEKQIEKSIKQRQVDQIKREVQEVLKSQKDELVNEYRKMHKAAVKQQNMKPKPSGAVRDKPDQPLQDELVLLMDEEYDDEDEASDGGHQDYDVIYEENEPLMESNSIKQESEPAAIVAFKKSPVYKIVADSAGEEDDAHISVHYHEDEEEESVQDEMSYLIEQDGAESEAGVHNEELFIVGDNASEYLEEGNAVDDMEAIEESESVLGDEVGNDDITESLRKAIESNTGIRMQPDYKYKFRKTNRDAKHTKIEVTNDLGSGVAVCDLDDMQPVNLDENGEMKIFQCDSCPEAFARRIQLTRHMPMHENRRGHMCEYCLKWFPSKSSLVRHHRTHTGEKPFKCKVCGRSFIQKEILKRHEMIHTGERPYACTECDKTFTQRDILKQHFNRQHSESPVIDLHKCPKCPKTFFHASGLSRHILIHSGRKFPCEHCDKPFNDKSALKRHIVSLHGDRM